MSSEASPRRAREPLSRHSSTLSGFWSTITKGTSYYGELVGDLPTDPAEAVEYIVFVKLVKLSPHPPPFEVTLNRPFYAAISTAETAA